jgi:hypothetical protein
VTAFFPYVTSAPRTWGASWAAAFARAQGAFEDVTKDQTAKVSSERASYEYDYATLAAYSRAARRSLRENELGVSQEVWVSDREFATDDKGQKYVAGLLVNVQTLLVHSSGEFKESKILSHWLPGARITEVGSCSSYLKRYQLVAQLGMSADEEDDEDKLPQHQRHGGDTQPTASTSSKSGTSRPQSTVRTSGSASKPITSAQLTVLQRKAQDAGMSAEDICRRYSIQSLDKLPFDKMADAVAFISDPQREVLEAQS